MITSFTQKKGFTLIEMLVAVALFSIVLIIAMGSIITIVDVNRKSQSLTTVMNDLNFALENVTRSIKTGDLDSGLKRGTDYIDYEAITVTPQEAAPGEEITYALDEGKITRNDVAITSDQIHIDKLVFRVFWNDNNRQPRVLMMVDGVASTSQKISSRFTIQTTVSQRDLDTGNFE